MNRFYSAIAQFLEGFGADDDALTEALVDEAKLRESAPLVRQAQDLIATDASWEPLWSTSTFKGPAGIIEYGQAFTEILGEWSWTIHRLDAAGDHVLGEFTVHTRGKVSGVPTEQKMWNVFDVEDSRITRYREFVDQAEARSAVGLPD